MLSFQFWSIPARIAAVGSILLVLFLLMMHNDATPYQYVKSYVVEPQSMNATLNFQEIFYITMPHRTDRQDAMSLLASSTGLKLKMFPGVDSTKMNLKAKPLLPDSEESKYNATFMGVWRAHANIWKHIIDKDISSALIIEDDVDWDVNIKSIMGAWSWQLQHNNSLHQVAATTGDRWTSESDEKKCAYGCDWDELYMGQCANTPDPEHLEDHWSYYDPHTPAVSTNSHPTTNEMVKVWGYDPTTTGIRVVSRTYGPLCTMGYAVSNLGAKRMLYQIGGWRLFGLPVDNEIAFRTQEGKLSGYTLTPPAFTAWHTGGSRDSDNNAGIENNGFSSQGVAGGSSPGLLNSARKAMAELLDMDRRKPVFRGSGRI